jgi:hypothetical protein
VKGEKVRAKGKGSPRGERGTGEKKSKAGGRQGAKAGLKPATERKRGPGAKAERKKKKGK